MTEVADAIRTLTLAMTAIGVGITFALIGISCSLWGRR